ncbi:phage tail tape measure protein [Wujia chipingensis]|uniref:Phage tail tape measure protein n=1 Tax=Wujia chipingensis TaxID=2763670 RepID=A0A7G9FPW6_9FIRM|nr:phage tail tape measure protein [Wujia chipingensis]QNM00598.1 phage tail tape measure protein [Wujia chipingensis]
MSDNNFIVNLTAKLHSKSKQQIESDAKNLGDIKVPLVGTLDQAKTSAQLKQDVASLKTTVDINGKVNTKNITSTVQQSAKQAQKTADANTIQFRTSLKKDKLINDIRVFGQQNSKLFKDAEMSSKFSSLLDNAKLATSNKEIKNLRMQLSAMRSEAKATNLSGLTLGDSVKKTFRRATELFTGTAGVMMLSRQLKNAWNEALDLDKAFTDLIKVNDELSRGDYDKYLERCNEKAQDLAATQKSLMEGATEFSKSGYNLSESNALAEKSTILANVGDMSTSDSAKAIISGVQAYKDVDGFTDAVNKAGALIDKYNEIGNTASITSAEIAQGVQTVGSVFADANTSVDEFIALLSAGNRQFQNADTLALSLRTAALRIRGCKSELESLGESTENVYTSSSKLADKIESLTNIDGNGGVKILEADNKTFRSIYDIFVDLSKVYQQMSDVDQSALLDLIAGKNRASGISATLNNMSEAQDIYERSLHSTGSAQREYDKYLESSEASLNRFKASMTETYQSVINGQTVTGLLNCGNAALQFANSIGLVESSLKGLLTIGIIKVLTTVTTAFRASAIQASNFGTALSAVKSMSTLQSGTTEYTNALNTLKAVSASLTETQLKHILSNDALNESERVRILRSTGLSKTQAKAKLAEMELTQATQKQAVANQKASLSTFSLSSAVKGLGQNIKMAVMNNPVAVAVMTVSAIAGVVKAIKKHKQAQEEAFESAKKNAQDAQSKIKSLQSEIKQNADTVDQAGKKYAELAQGVNQLTGKNISLSDDEYKEFLDVSNQLADVFPQLTKGYDDNGNAILDLQGNVDGITGKLKDLLEIEQQLAQQEINKNIDTYFENQSKVFGKEAKGQNDTIDTQTEKIEKYQKALDNFNESVSNNKPASNFESELEKQTYYADFLADMEKANIDIADAIISQDGTSATEYNFAKLSKETQEQIRQYYAGIISTANTEMRSAESQLSTSNAEFASYVNMWMQNSSGSYLAMTGNDEMQSALSSIVSGLNWGDILQGDDFSGLSGEELESAIETNILVPLQSAMANADTGDQFKQIITDALTISDDDISLEESKNRIEAYVQEINDVLGDALGKPLTASDLGMQKYLDNYEMLMDGVSKYAQTLKSDGSIPMTMDVMKESKDKLLQFAEENSINTEAEIQTWNRIMSESETREEAMKKYLTQKSVYDTTYEFDPATAFDAAKSAQSEQSQNGYLSTETIESLKTAYGDLSKVIQYTDSGVVLNNEHMAEYTENVGKAALVNTQLKEAFAVQEYQKEAKAINDIIKTEIKDTNVRKKLTSAKNKGIDALRKEISNLKKDNDGWSESLSTHLDNISALGEEINQYDALEQSIMASLSALSNYKRALETPDNNDNFEYVQGQLDSARKAWENGWTGTDDFKTFMEYIGSANDELEYSDALWDKYLTRAEKYFTEDISGLYTFLDDASQLSDQITKNSDGTFKIDVQNLEQFCEDVDMSRSAVVDLFLAMTEAEGIDINFDNMSESIVDGLNAIDQKSVDARTDLADYKKTIEELDKAGFDTTELWKQYDSVAGEIQPEIEFYAHLADTTDLQSEAEEAAKRISEKDQSVKIDFSADLDVDSLNKQISSLQTYRDGLEIGSDSWKDAQTVIAQLLKQKQELEQPAIMGIDASQVEEGSQTVLAVLQSYISAKQQLEQAETLGIDTTDAETHLANVTTQLQNLQDQGELTKIGIDAEIDTDKFKEQLANLNPDSFLKDSDTSIKVDADMSAYDKALNNAVSKASKQTAKIKVQAKLSENFHANLQSILNSQSFNVKVNASASGTTTTSHGNTKTRKTVMFGKASGTNAYNNGVRNGQIAYDQQALVGEVAPELLVRNGQAQLIGKRGAEFMNLKKGDVIFNHIDTEKLLNGIGGIRGKLIGGGFVNGTLLSHAYSKSTGSKTTIIGGTNNDWTNRHSSSGSSSGSNSSGSNDSSAQDKADEFLETIDWIEIKINRCEEAIARLNKTEENTFSGWTLRTTALNDEIAKTADEIEWATQGYKRYLQQADSVALSEDYKRKVRNGEINIEDITDEDLYNRVQDYQNWYEKAVELQDKIQELNISLSELAQKKFDNIVTQFEDMEKVFTDTNDILDKLVDYAETKGRIISKSYYEAMLQNENENNKLLVQQRDQMVSELNELVNTGKVTEYSEAWYDLKQQIDEVNGSIVESNKSIQEFYNNIRQADWDLFDLVQDKITGIADEIEFVQSLLEDRDNLTDGHLNRGLTNEGLAQLGNYASKYNIYMSQAEKYASEIKKIEADIAKDPANKDLIDRKEELIKAQRDVILSANDEKKSMIDLARDGYDAVLEVLQDLIDKKKEALSSTKDLYEYQKDIASKTKDLATLEKEASVYENDNSEEALKKVQQIKVDIESKKQELSDAEYDKYIEDQEKMLDDLYQEYSDKIDEKFEQTEILIQELIGVVNENQSSISDTITTVTSDVGYTISDQMKTIWNDAGTVISGFTGKFDTYATTVQSAINSIQVTIDKMLQIAQAEANKNIATANNPNGVANGSTSNGSTASKPQATPKANANNNSSATQAPKASPNVGTRVNATGNWYYDSYGTAPTGNVNRFKPDYFEIDKIANGRAYPYHIQAIIKGKRAGGNGWVKGNQIGYKNGLKEATYDHLAWTQEEGAEIIRRSDGSILTPITRGTTVFTREMTDNLWNIAKQNPEKFYQNAMPTMNTFATTNRGGDVTVSIGDIKLDGIQNPDQFAQALIGVVKDYSKVQKVLQAATVDLVAGKSIKDINRF